MMLICPNGRKKDPDADFVIGGRKTTDMSGVYASNKSTTNAAAPPQRREKQRKEKKTKQ